MSTKKRKHGERRGVASGGARKTALNASSFATRRPSQLGERLYTVLRLVKSAKAHDLICSAFEALGDADVEDCVPTLDLAHLEAVLQALEDFLYDHGAFPEDSEVPVPIGLGRLTEDEVWRATGAVLKQLEVEGVDPLSITEEDLTGRCLGEISKLLSTTPSRDGSISG